MYSVLSLFTYTILLKANGWVGVSEVRKGLKGATEQLVA